MANPFNYFWRCIAILGRFAHVVVSVSVPLVLPLASTAGEYSFVKLVDTSGSFSKFTGFPAPTEVRDPPAINDHGTVAFQATHETGVRGVFTTDGTAVTVIADSDGPFIGFVGPPTMNNHGEVAFLAVTGIFVGDGTTITTIAGSAGQFSGFAGEPSVNDNGVVAFNASLDAGGRGIFVSDGTTTSAIAEQGSGPFANVLGAPALNNGGTVVFGGVTLDAVEGIFTSDGVSLQTIADTTDIFDGFFAANASINSRGEVAFLAALDAGGRGIFVGDGTTTSAIADGFLFPAINDLGTIAFIGLPGGGFGIFTGPDPVADKVVAVGDLLFGSTITALLFQRDGLNNRDQVAFWASFADGSEAIVRADPNLDHFLLYTVRSDDDDELEAVVSLADQFESGMFKVDEVARLGNPVDKNGEGISDVDTHLVAYEIEAGDDILEHQPRLLRVENQFGALLLNTIEEPDALLVPSLKSLEGPIPGDALPDPFPVDHFACYEVKLSKGERFKQIQVHLQDQFQQQPKRFVVQAPEWLCNPVDKNGEGVQNEDDHLLCYRLRRMRYKSIRDIHVNNQFGPLKLEAERERELCVPSTKEVLGFVPDDDDIRHRR